MLARKAQRAAVLDLMTEGVTLALRPYGIDPANAEACATTLRKIADALSVNSPLKAPPRSTTRSPPVRSLIPRGATMRGAAMGRTRCP